MAAIKFTLNALSGATSRSLRFEPRNAPWVNDAGKIVTPDGFTKTYVRNIENTENLDVGPWRVRIGSGVDDWYSFDVTSAGGNLKDLIAFGIPDDTPASSLTAAVEAFGTQWLSTFTDTTLAAKVTGSGPMKAALDNSYPQKPSGTPNGSKFLRDDNSWQSPPAGNSVSVTDNGDGTGTLSNVAPSGTTFADITGTLPTAKLADGAVTTDKIAFGKALPKYTSNPKYAGGTGSARTAAQNSAAIAAAIADCAVGDTLVFTSDTAVLEIASAVSLKPRVRYTFPASFGKVAGLTLKAASGFSGKALMQSAVMASTSQTVCDDPVVVAGPALDGNKSVNTTGTYVGIALCGYWSQIIDPYISNMPSHDILLTDRRWDNGIITNSCSENQILRPKLDGSKANPIKVESWNGASNMDGHILDGWMSNFGGNGIEIDRAAGWTIRNNHMYGVGKSAVIANRCYGTKITHNYIEDFGAANAAGGYYAGISASLLDHWSTDISDNFVGQNVFSPDNAARRPSYQIGAGSGQVDARVIMRGNATYCAGGSSVQYAAWFDVDSGGKLTVDIDRVTAMGTWAQPNHINTASVTVITPAMAADLSTETAYAASTLTETLATSAADIPGIVCSVAQSDSPQMLSWYPAGFYGDNTGTITYQIVRQSDSAVVAFGMVNTSVAEGYKVPGALQYRIPPGAAADTYRGQAWRSAGSAACTINPWAKTNFIEAVRL